MKQFLREIGIEHQLTAAHSSESNSNIYKIYHSQKRRVVVSRDVIIYENEFAYYDQRSFSEFIHLQVNKEEITSSFNIVSIIAVNVVIAARLSTFLSISNMTST